MVNQQKIFPMGRLQVVTVDIEGAIIEKCFEVIEIVDDSNPYPALLGIDWATNMNGVINLKKWKIIFDKKSLRIVIPLDPTEGAHYAEPVHDQRSDDDLEYIYKTTTRDQDWLNPTAEGRISWEHTESCTADSYEEDKQWHNQLNGVTMLNCNLMSRSLCCITTQDQDLPIYDGLMVVDEFLNKFENTVPKHQRFDALKWALCTTLACWWGTHEGTFED